MPRQLPPRPLPRSGLLRRRRRQFSCDACRASKLKCDRGRPVCSTCRTHGRTPEQCTRKGVPVSQDASEPRHVPLPAQRHAATPDHHPVATAATAATAAHSATPNPHSSGPPPITPFLPPTASFHDMPRPAPTTGHPILQPPSAATAASTSSSSLYRNDGPPSTMRRGLSSPPPWSPEQPSPDPTIQTAPPEHSESGVLKTACGSVHVASRARKLLPPRLVQLEAMLDLYWNKIAVVCPSYDPGMMLQRARDLYLLPLTEGNFWPEHMTGMTVPVLAWLCAVCSAVLRLAQPTRLLIWGIVDDAASVAQQACELNQMAREALRAACIEGERAMCPIRGCPAALIRIQAAIATAHSASCGAPPPGCSEVLDVAIRYARQAGLDRLGKVSQRPRTLPEYEQAACWLALVCADWRAAPYLGCYTIYPNTYTTEWDLSLDELVESHEQLSRANRQPSLETGHDRSEGPSPRPYMATERSAGTASPDAESLSGKGTGADDDPLREPRPPIGSVDDHASMWVWAWQVRIAGEARKLCDLGVHDAAQRVTVGYDKVKDHDRSLQQILQSRPPELVVEAKKETRNASARTKVKRFPWLLIQAVAVTIPLRTILLSLHMPYVLGAYQESMRSSDSSKALSIASALEQSVYIVRGTQRASMKGIILHRQWPLRHSLFNAGLLLIFDLLLRNSSLLPPVYPGGAFGEHSLDEEVALAIECLDDSSWRRGRSEVADVPWVDNADWPFHLDPSSTSANRHGAGLAAPSAGRQHFTGERLERLLVLALRRNGQQGDGALAVDSYMQAYTTDMIGHRRSVTRTRTIDILPAALRARSTVPPAVSPEQGQGQGQGQEREQERQREQASGHTSPASGLQHAPARHAELARQAGSSRTTTPPRSGLREQPPLPCASSISSSETTDTQLSSMTLAGASSLPPTLMDLSTSGSTSFHTGSAGEGTSPAVPLADGNAVPSATSSGEQVDSVPHPLGLETGSTIPFSDANYLEELLHFADSSTGLPVDAILADPFLLNLTPANISYPV